MKLSAAMVLTIAGLCGQAYADVQANTNTQAEPLNSKRMVGSKPANATVLKNCNEIGSIAKSVMTSRLNGVRVQVMQAKVEDMFTNPKSPVKGDKLFKMLTNRVVLAAYSETNVPPKSDVKGQNTLINNFSYNQRMMCIEYLNHVVKNQK